MENTSKNRKGKRSLKIKILILFLVVIAFIVYIVVGENILSVTTYEIESEKTAESFSFVLISDLHNREFGENNSRLVKLIEEQAPEFIVIAGDMIVEGESDYSVCVSLVSKLVEIAPVYYAPGNHEKDFIFRQELESEIIKAGAVYLSNEMTYHRLKEDKILIGGLRQYPYFEFDMPYYDNAERHFFDRFLKAQEQNFSLLICHYPETFSWGLKNFNIDLMLCGHTHGGIVQIPFVGGVKIPNQPLFSEYDKGYFESAGARMIITSGLGNSYPVPRINNPPEVCVIKIN